MSNEYGYTPPGVNYPAFINAKAVEGRLQISVRSPANADGTCGAQAYILLDRKAAIDLVAGIANVLEEDAMAAIADHNSALRSASQIAQRAGADTNWDGYSKTVMKVLTEHHQIGNQARDARGVAV